MESSALNLWDSCFNRPLQISPHDSTPVWIRPHAFTDCPTALFKIICLTFYQFCTKLISCWSLRKYSLLISVCPTRRLDRIGFCILANTQLKVNKISQAVLTARVVFHPRFKKTWLSNSRVSLVESSFLCLMKAVSVAGTFFLVLTCSCAERTWYKAILYFFK